MRTLGGAIRCLVGAAVLADTAGFFAFGFAFLGAEGVLAVFLIRGAAVFFFDIRGQTIESNEKFFKL